MFRRSNVPKSFGDRMFRRSNVPNPFGDQMFWRSSVPRSFRDQMCRGSNVPEITNSRRSSVFGDQVCVSRGSGGHPCFDPRREIQVLLCTGAYFEKFKKFFFLNSAFVYGQWMVLLTFFHLTNHCGFTARFSSQILTLFLTKKRLKNLVSLH